MCQTGNRWTTRVTELQPKDGKRRQKKQRNRSRDELGSFARLAWKRQLIELSEGWEANFVLQWRTLRLMMTIITMIMMMIMLIMMIMMKELTSWNDQHSVHCWFNKNHVSCLNQQVSDNIIPCQLLLKMWWVWQLMAEIWGFLACSCYFCSKTGK